VELVSRSEYIAFVFMASVAVLQLVGAFTQLKGLLFFRNRPLTYCLSFLLIVGSFYWFFARDDRWDTIMRHTSLEGKQQFLYFCLAAFLAVMFTLIASSLLAALRARRQNKGTNNPGQTADPDPGEGLDKLKEMSYFEALKSSFRSKRD
jgi:hypothetical protein